MNIQILFTNINFIRKCQALNLEILCVIVSFALAYLYLQKSRNKKRGCNEQPLCHILVLLTIYQ